MFPNIRLMIVAVLASILGISCALGLFAEFRVSHDSFLRESNANAPMQLGANDAAPARVMNTAMPFEFRFQASPAAAEIAARTIIFEHAAAVEPAPVAPVVTPMVVTAPETAAPPALPISSASVAETPPVNSPAPGPALAAPPFDGVSRGPASAARGSTVPERANPAAPSRSAPTTRRHRSLVVRRPRPAVSGQAVRRGLTGTQPGYQWAAPSGLGAPQTVHRRVIVRRARPAKLQAREPVAASATPPTAASDTSAVKPPE
jgi:hypothetical protein